MKLLAAVLIAAFIIAALIVGLWPRPPPPKAPASWCYVEALNRAVLCSDLRMEREA